MKKRFVSLFPGSENMHLLKDVGMIPYVLYRDYGYDSTLVTFENGDYPSLEKEVKGLKLRFMGKNPGYKIGKASFKVVSFLWKNAKQIDILNLYHTTKETLLYGLIYKLRHPSGILYLKLDLNIDHFKQCLTPLKKCGYQFFFSRITDLISSELDVTEEYLQSVFTGLHKKWLKIPNGIDEQYIQDLQITRNNYTEKENLIITVGRIGSPEKNHQLLLEAIKNIPTNEHWTFAFIGPVDDRFLPVVQDFFKQYPHLKERVLFTGVIYNRQELYSWYNRAKVFCLTSLWESFGIVLIEALYWGNYIVSTPVSSVKEITHNESVGKVVNNEKELQTVLEKIISGDIDLQHYQTAIAKQARKYIWKDILQNLHERIQSIL
ncbi:glycosyltransferase family 4 protein [Parabacteroides sp. PF5-9]|uniref:glycosyltransferase family 4 protein n=1 Tax=Parabacteroides sp. PF5-9 TaxID=1742404 RepID=UPI0024755A75|nr:glycosyltransferase family 4 protein [Parabacteroides sp. PF5-9]MDH6358707.1 glycosyltransferase involved in cell wall biosynthesis [Parabacteroides sp. PF5-9]